MSDRDGTLNNPGDHALASALRALPAAAPQPDLWPDLASALHRRRHPRRARVVIPAALAAGLALALLWPRAVIRQTVPEAPHSVATQTATRDEIVDLHQRSQALERWIAAAAAHAPQDSRDLMAAVEVEDLIGLVDVQLGAVRDSGDALPLWRQRVALLEDLATIRVGGFAIAANDDVFANENASFYRIN